MRSRRTTLALAAAACVPVLVPAVCIAGTVTWNYDGTAATSNSWATTGSWNPTNLPTSADDALLGSVITAARTLTLDGTQTINNLVVNATQNYTLTPGTATPSSKLILLNGNMSLTTEGNGKKVDFGAVPIQLGPDNTPVSATWTLANTGTEGINKIGALIGHANSSLTLTSTLCKQSVWFSAASPDYHGTVNLTLQPVVATSLGATYYVTANNALGDGTVHAGSASVTAAFDFNTSTRLGTTIADTSHAMTLQLDGKTGIVIGGWNSNNIGAVSTATLNGALTGSGELILGNQSWVSSTGFRNGRLVLANASNSLSGDITISNGELRVNGGWTGTGTGNIAVKAGSTATSISQLSGSGTIGMGSGKKLTVTGGTTPSPYDGWLAPGTAMSAYDITLGGNGFGTVGTLTVGTTGNSNEVDLDQYSKLRIDLLGGTADAGKSDRLVVNGVLNILAGKSNQNLYLFDNGVNDLRGTYTIATFDSLAGDTQTFDNVYFNGVLVTNPTATNGINGQGTLVYGTNDITIVGQAVPEPGSALGLLGVGALAAIRRRRKM